MLFFPISFQRIVEFCLPGLLGKGGGGDIIGEAGITGLAGIDGEAGISTSLVFETAFGLVISLSGNSRE